MPTNSKTIKWVFAFADAHPFTSYALMMRTLFHYGSVMVGHLICEYDIIADRPRNYYMVQFIRDKVKLTPINEVTYLFLKDAIKLEEFDWMNKILFGDVYKPTTY